MSACSCGRTRLRWPIVASVLAMALVALAGPAAPTASADPGSMPGQPLWITTGELLDCGLSHGRTFDYTAQVYGGEGATGACGTQVAVDGDLYGAGALPKGNTSAEFDVVEPPEVTRESAEIDFWRSEAAVRAGETGIEITQVDVYEDVADDYRTRLTVRNRAEEVREVVVFRAFDCLVDGDDFGLGALGDDGSVSCDGYRRTDEDDGSKYERSGRSLTLTPVVGAADRMQAQYDRLWAAVDQGTALPDTCECDDLHDNAVALSWSLVLEPGDRVELVHRTTLWHLEPIPLASTPWPRQPTQRTGADNSVRGVLHNQNNHPVTVTPSHVLPDGAHYRENSVVWPDDLDLPDPEPTIDGNTLTWASFTMPRYRYLDFTYDVSGFDEPGELEFVSATSATYLLEGEETSLPVDNGRQPLWVFAPYCASGGVSGDPPHGGGESILNGDRDADGPYSTLLRLATNFTPFVPNPAPDVVDSRAWARTALVEVNCTVVVTAEDLLGLSR